MVEKHTVAIAGCRVAQKASLSFSVMGFVRTWLLLEHKLTPNPCFHSTRRTFNALPGERVYFCQRQSRNPKPGAKKMKHKLGKRNEESIIWFIHLMIF